jgi:hypothetical protein
MAMRSGADEDRACSMHRPRMAEGALDAVAAGAADGPLNAENVPLRYRLRALCNQQLPHAEAWRSSWWEHLLFHCPAVARQHESTQWHILMMIYAHQRAQVGCLFTTWLDRLSRQVKLSR